MDKKEVLKHLDAIERYIENGKSALRCAENRLLFLRDMLKLKSEEYKDLEEKSIEVKVEG